MDKLHMRLPGVVYEIKHYRFTLLSKIVAEIEIHTFDEQHYSSRATILETGECIGGSMFSLLEEALQDIVSRLEKKLEHTKQMQEAIEIYQSIGMFLDYAPAQEAKEKNS